MNEENRGRRGAFFGRRQGHRLRPRRAGLLQSLLPRLALYLTRPADDPTRLFSPKVDEMRLEIGFGGGEHLIGQAEREPQVGFFGVEPFVNGMARALAASAAKGRAHVRLHQGDALEVIAWLPAASLARVDLVYPDPWPKRRHWKRRFVQDSTIKAMARVLKAGGEVRFVSDIDHY